MLSPALSGTALLVQMATGLPPVMSALGLSVLTTFNFNVLEAATTSQEGCQ